MSFISSERSLISAAAILGIAFVIGVLIASHTAYTIRISQDVIEVTGSARVAVTSDFARWTITAGVNTGLHDKAEGYARLEEASKQILQYLNERGYDLVETPIPMAFPNFVHSEQAGSVQTGYQIQRNFVVRSDDVAGIQALASNIVPFTGPHHNIINNSLELTYKNLPETRVTLLTAAIADAKARAEAIARESGREVGDLRTAASGVVQVLPVGGVEVSDFGTYDTASMEKEVMVTVRAKFSLN